MAITFRPSRSPCSMISRYGSHALAVGARPTFCTAGSVITCPVMAGFSSGESAITSPVMAGLAPEPVDAGHGGQLEASPPRRRTGMPAACKYSPAVSRRTWISRSIRRSDHPSRPSANICSRFSSPKTLAIPAVGPHGPLRVNVSAPSVVAAFQVIIDGRFWVITEAPGAGRGHTMKHTPDVAAHGIVFDAVAGATDTLGRAEDHELQRGRGRPGDAPGESEASARAPLV